MLDPAKPRRLNEPIAISLEDLVPQDHFYRHLENKLDLSFVRELVKATEGVVVYRAEAGICNACPVKTQCTASDQGRIVHRSFYAEYLDRVRGYHATETYQKAMRKRQVWVELLVAEAKEWHGLRWLRLRGLMHVNIQELLIAAGQNLKRVLAASGWGRRHTPWGSLVALSMPSGWLRASSG
jgi:hypothetical protein